MHRLARVAFVAALTLTAALGIASSASATYHDNRIREVHDGTGTATGDYVVLQAHSPGQNFVAGKHIVTYDGGGAEFSDYTIPGNVANGASQATILIATALPGADFTPGSGTGDGNLGVVNTGGTVCFTENDGATGIDCIAYAGPGLFAFPPVPPASPYGTPFFLGGPNFDGKSIVRSTGRGCATLLEAADDTNDSRADFAFGAPLARNNAAPITETACPPTSATPTAPAKKAKKCKKKKKRSAEAAAKKKCKKKKKRR